MRNKYGLILVFLLPFISLFAQKDPPFSLFPWTQPFYNPGALGEKEQHINFIGTYRQGEVFMKDENSSDIPDEYDRNIKDKDKPNKDKFVPQGQQNIYLNIDSYIKQIKGAVGVSFLKDKIGFNNFSGFSFGYAAKLPLYGGKLGIGVQFGFINKSTTPNYTYTDSGDPLLTQGSETSLDFDMSLGVQYRAPTWFVGLSCRNLIDGVRISGVDGTTAPTRNLYAMGGYIWNLKTPVPWSVEPSLLIQSDFATWSFGLMALARYNGILWFGASYQMNNGIAVILGAVPFFNSTNRYLKGIEIGLSYTFQTKNFAYRKYGSWGDVEILIRYGFNFYREKPLTGYGSSRHLYKNQY